MLGTDRLFRPGGCGFGASFGGGGQSFTGKTSKKRMGVGSNFMTYNLIQ